MITDESITQIANQLGIATEHIYEVFVAAQPTIAIMQLACCIIVIGCVALGFHAHKKYELTNDIPPAAVAFVFGLAGVFISLVVHDSARCYFLPEYSAIIKLMELTIGGI